jgi:hypothetical protein
MIPDVTAAINIVKDFGYLAILAVVLVTGASKKWVFGRELEDEKKMLIETRKERDQFREQLNDMRYQRDEWRIAALYSKNIAERSQLVSSHAVETAEKLVLDGPQD